MDSFRALSSGQRATLTTGGINNISDLLIPSSSEIAKKCRVPISDVQAILDVVCKDHSHQAPLLSDLGRDFDDTITTGDALLDDALGGGIATGMIWDVTGESAAGKTQLAFQLALSVQLPQAMGGLLGSACYLTTRSNLPTSRLVQLLESHPSLTSSNASLDDIHIISITELAALVRVLTTVLSSFIADRAASDNAKPVRLVILDSLTELFHATERTTTISLSERSRNISEIAVLLHTLASEHNIAVVTLNEVVDVFERSAVSETPGGADMVYRDQSRWFNCADSIPGEDMKEAGLGLVWANQVNARIMLSRTGRRRYLDEVAEPLAKRRRVDDPLKTTAQPLIDGPALIRRINILFSPLSRPASLDYIITSAGISILTEDGSVPDERQTPNR